MRTLWNELRGAISVLVLLGLVARLLMPLGAFAATQRAAFDLALQGQLCLNSGLPAPDDTTDGPRPARGDHCALCRLPDALGLPPPFVRLPEPRLLAAPAVALVQEEWILTPPARGPPPARAPPILPTLA